MLSAVLTIVKIGVKLLPVFGFIFDAVKGAKLNNIRTLAEEAIELADVIEVSLKDGNLTDDEVRAIKSQIAELRLALRFILD